MIIENSEVDYSIQNFRDGCNSRSKKLSLIKNGISKNGYKLKYPPISIFDWGNFNTPAKHDSIEVITGNTRGFIIENGPFFMENAIVALYGPALKDDNSGEYYSEEEYLEALEDCGGYFNSIHDESEIISKEDVKYLTDLSIDRFEKTKGATGTAPLLPQILEKVNKLCGEGALNGPTTREKLSHEIYNRYCSISRVVIPWSDTKSASYRTSTFLRHHFKFLDTEKIMYVVVSTGNGNSAWAKAVMLSSQYPDKEIRLILHTGTLSGYDYHKSYREKISGFTRYFNFLTENACNAFYGKKVLTVDGDEALYVQPKIKNNIVIYAAFPALGEYHNIHNPIMINSEKNYAYQKYSASKEANYNDTDDYKFNFSEVENKNEDEDE